MIICTLFCYENLIMRNFLVHGFFQVNLPLDLPIRKISRSFIFVYEVLSKILVKLRIIAVLFSRSIHECKNVRC